MRIEAIQCDICQKPLASEELFINFMAFFNRAQKDEDGLSKAPETIDVCQKCYDEKFAEYFVPKPEDVSSDDIVDSIAAQRFP